MCSTWNLKSMTCVHWKLSIFEIGKWNKKVANLYFVCKLKLPVSELRRFWSRFFFALILSNAYMQFCIAYRLNRFNREKFENEWFQERIWNNRCGADMDLEICRFSLSLPLYPFLSIHSNSLFFCSKLFKESENFNLKIWNVFNLTTSWMECHLTTRTIR